MDTHIYPYLPERRVLQFEVGLATGEAGLKQRVGSSTVRQEKGEERRGGVASLPPTLDPNGQGGGDACTVTIPQMVPAL